MADIKMEEPTPRRLREAREDADSGVILRGGSHYLYCPSMDAVVTEH
jgi:hypothetical protein